MCGLHYILEIKKRQVAQSNTMTLGKSINELSVGSIVVLYMTLGLWGANKLVGAYNLTINKIHFELQSALGAV